MIIDRNNGDSVDGFTLTQGNGSVASNGTQIVVDRNTNDCGLRRTAGISGADGQKYFWKFNQQGVAFDDTMTGLVDADALDYTQMIGVYIQGNGTNGSWEKAGATADNNPQAGSLDTDYDFSMEIGTTGAVTIKRGATTLGTTVPATSGDYTAKTLRFMSLNISSGEPYWLSWYAATDDGTFTPPTPASPSATASSSTETDVSWDANGANSVNADFFSIERSLSSGSGFVEIDTTPDIITDGYDDSGLDPETTYYYRIRAAVVVNGTTYYSSYSAETSATTDSAGNWPPASSASYVWVTNYFATSSAAYVWKTNR